MSKFITGYVNTFNYNQSVSIANGAQSSAAINCGGMVLVGIMFPAAFTGTAITFEMCDTIDGTYVPMYNAAGVMTYTIAQGRYIAVNRVDFYGVNFLKIKSGSAEGAIRTLVCSLKGF